MITSNAYNAVEALQNGERFVMFNGDCRDLLRAIPGRSIGLTVSSPPYFLGKRFDISRELKDFTQLHEEIFPDLERQLEETASLCWQVGHHVRNGIGVPLDFVVHSVFAKSNSMVLRNRIIWTFGHGMHARNRFSGRHETIMWYTIGPNYFFDLDAVRVPQKYKGKKYYKGPKKGLWSSNPAGKNPGDVWDIPNVKANHVEKTEHPCQFPVALAQRLVKSLCRTNGVVFDPFAGVGSTGIAAALEGRAFIGAELDSHYCEIAERRWKSVLNATVKVRPIDMPVFQPDPYSTVAKNPFTMLSEGRN